MFVREENNSNNNSTKLVEGLKSYLQDTLQSTQLAKHLQYFSTGISIQCLAEINSRSHFWTNLRHRWGLLVWFAFEVGVLKAREQLAVPLPGFINCLISAVRNRKLCSEQGNTRRVVTSAKGREGQCRWLLHVQQDCLSVRDTQMDADGNTECSRDSHPQTPRRGRIHDPTLRWLRGIQTV